MKLPDYDEPKKETTTVTFRISTNIINLLHTETEQKNISLNSLIAKILNEYIEWEQYKNKIGMVCLPKSVVSELFQRMTDDEVIALAENMGKGDYAGCGTIYEKYFGYRFILELV